MNDSLIDLHAELRRAPEYVVHEMMDQIRYQLRRRMAETQTTQAALAEAMGVKPPVVSRLLRAAENTSLLTIARAARALGLTFTALKLIPDEHAEHQMDEFGALLRTDGVPDAWWLRSRTPGARARCHGSVLSSSAPSNPVGLGYVSSGRSGQGTAAFGVRGLRAPLTPDGEPA